MNTRLTIEVTDLVWTRTGKSLDEDYVVGTSILGNFRIDIRYWKPSSPRSYRVTTCPVSALVPSNDREHPTIEGAKAVCQQVYRTVILSTIYLRREEL